MAPAAVVLSNDSDHGNPGYQMSAAATAPMADAATQRFAETSGSSINIHWRAPMIQPDATAATNAAATEPSSHPVVRLIRNWAAM